jgi:hypothetical protein
MSLSQRNNRVGPTLLVPIAITVVVVIAYAGAVELMKSKDNFRDIASDHHAYYLSSDLGKSGSLGLTIPYINYTNNDYPEFGDTVGVYMYKPPQLLTSFDAMKYLSKFNFTVATDEYELEDDLGFLKHCFVDDNSTISVVQNGFIRVYFHFTNSSENSDNVTVDNATLQIENYLVEHNMRPLCNYSTKVTKGMKIDADTGEAVPFQYTFKYFQELEDFRVIPGYWENHIYVVYDNIQGEIKFLEYHWPDFEKTDAIDSSELGSVSEIVDDFIEKNNEEVNLTDAVQFVNVTQVSIVYSLVLGTSLLDSPISHLYYIYVPYIMVSWDGGGTFLSPLAKDV